MKIEIIEELRFGHAWPWYTLQVNGEDVYGSWSRAFVEDKFEEIGKQGKFEKVIKNIVKSKEISVSSSEEVNNNNK